MNTHPKWKQIDSEVKLASVILFGASYYQMEFLQRMIGIAAYNGESTIGRIL